MVVVVVVGRGGKRKNRERNGKSNREETVGGLHGRKGQREKGS